MVIPPSKATAGSHRSDGATNACRALKYKFHRLSPTSRTDMMVGPAGLPSIEAGGDAGAASRSLLSNIRFPAADGCDSFGPSTNPASWMWT